MAVKTMLSTFHVAASLFCLLSQCIGIELSGWTYQNTSASCVGDTEDPCGPTYWYKLPDSASCQGSSQSPVDIVQAIYKPRLTGPSFTASNGGCTSWRQFSDNTSYVVDLTSTSCTSLSLTYSGVSYTLTELHFHSPSEHSLGGGFFPAEAHMVHAASDGSGERLVLAVLLMESTSGLYHSNNTFLNSLWTVAGDTLLTPNNTVTVSNNTANPLNPYATFLPASRMQYVYTGSLTTPPCTEGVTFIVYQQPIGISSDDLSLIRALAAAEPASASVLDRGNSNRPVQPLGGRLVYMTPGENAGSAIFDNEDSDDDGVSDSALGVGLAALAVGVFALVLAIYNNLVSQTMMRFGGKDKVQLSSESLDRALLFH